MGQIPPLTLILKVEGERRRTRKVGDERREKTRKSWSQGAFREL